MCSRFSHWTIWHKGRKQASRPQSVVDGAPKHFKLPPRCDQKCVKLYWWIRCSNFSLTIQAIALFLLFCVIEIEFTCETRLNKILLLGTFREISSIPVLLLLGFNFLKPQWWFGRTQDHFLHYKRNAYSYILALAITQFQQESWKGTLILKRTT